MKRSQNKFPKGWNEKSIKQLIKHYETQTEAEAVAEDEAAYRSTRMTMMAIPVELVPRIQRIITKRAG